MISRKVGEAIHDSVLPGMQSNLAITLIAVLVLIALALLAGLFAGSGPGKRIFAALEAGVLSQLPVYAILKQTVDDMTGNVERVGAGADLKVVEVAFVDHGRLGFLMDRAPDGRAVVFLPGAPSALKGEVVIVEADRLRETGLKAGAVIGVMGRLGAGIGERPPAAASLAGGPPAA